MSFSKEHLEGRAEALGEVIATLDERLAKGCGMWVYELRQELARVKGNCERRAEQSTPEYERRKAYDQGYKQGRLDGYAKGYETGHERGYNGLVYDSDPPWDWYN